MRKELLKTARLLVAVAPDLHCEIADLLQHTGFSRVQAVTEPRSLISLFDSYKPDLLVFDCTIANVDSLSLLKTLRSHVTEEDYLPILAITMDRSRRAHKDALSFGAKDLISKPFEHMEFLLRVNNLLETRFAHQHMEIVVKERTNSLLKAQRDLLDCLVKVADYRDGNVARHGRRVGKIACQIAIELGLPRHQAEQIGRAAELHDIGKIGIPDTLLSRPGKLTDAEFEEVKKHTSIGADILSGFTLPFLKLASEVARYHHEQWEGGGYLGLRGEAIPLAARITALADTVDALLQDRPYRAAQDFKEVLSIVRKQRGEQFDPQVVDAFLKLCSGDLEVLGNALVKEGAPPAPDPQTTHGLRRAIEGARDLWSRSAARPT
jgi:putative two-component system response regulator